MAAVFENRNGGSIWREAIDACRLGAEAFRLCEMGRRPKGVFEAGLAQVERLEGLVGRIWSGVQKNEVRAKEASAIASMRKFRFGYDACGRLAALENVNGLSLRQALGAGFSVGIGLKLGKFSQLALAAAHQGWVDRREATLREDVGGLVLFMAQKAYGSFSNAACGSSSEAEALCGRLLAVHGDWCLAAGCVADGDWNLGRHFCGYGNWLDEMESGRLGVFSTWGRKLEAVCVEMAREGVAPPRLPEHCEGAMTPLWMHLKSSASNMESGNGLAIHDWIWSCRYPLPVDAREEDLERAEPFHKPVEINGKELF